MAAVPFSGSGCPLSQTALDDSVNKLGVDAADFWAVLAVETRGFGFLPDKRPAILFERHIFHQRTGGKFSAAHPDISNSKPRGYGAGGANQYVRLAKAITLDRTAALESASWGLGQIMGFNATSVGFASVDKMVDAMVESEEAQVRAVVEFIDKNGLAAPLKSNNWQVFAKKYNGPRSGDYAKKLDRFHNLYTLHPPPDLKVRSAQAALLYLGFNPKGIDGVFGTGTQKALIAYQNARKLTPDGKLTDPVLKQLKAEAFP